MVTKTYCDYCNRELLEESKISFSIEGEEKDLCESCASRVKELLDSISKGN